MTDPNKKTSRTFQCREALWQKFEQMAKELECSVDYLINDAMKQYARQRGYGGTASLGPTASTSLPVSVPPASSPHSTAPTPPPLPPAAGFAPAPPPPPAPPMHSSVVAPLPPPVPPPVPGAVPPPPPPMSRGGGPPPPKRTSLGAPPPPPPAASRRAAPPVPPAPPGPPPLGSSRSLPPLPGGAGPRPQPGAGSGLSIHYHGEVFPVTKDRFIIGRGKQTSDLTIKDPNVSRQHAMIEFSSGQYYIVDMGSTNGVEFNGQRVQRRVIGEGDVFKVCDHELRFSFQ